MELKIVGKVESGLVLAKVCNEYYLVDLKIRVANLISNKQANGYFNAGMFIPIAKTEEYNAKSIVSDNRRLIK